MFLIAQCHLVILYLGCFLFILLGFSPPVASGDETLLRRFANEAEPAWVEYLAQNESLNKFKMETKINRSEPAFSYEYRISSTMIYSGHNRVSEETRFQKLTGPSPPRSPDPPKGKVANGHNNDYSFKIMEVGDQGFWSILSVEKESFAPHANKSSDIKMHRLWLLDFGPSKGYLAPVSASQAGQTPLVEVEFEFKKSEYTLPDGSERDLTNLSNWRLTFDPTNYWIPVSGSYFDDGERSHTQSTKWEYAYSDDGSLYMSRVVRTDSGLGPDMSVQVITEISAEVVDVDEDRFRLSYYGLPEPTTGSNRRPLVLIAIAVGLALLAFGFWLRRSKRTATAVE